MEAYPIPALPLSLTRYRSLAYVHGIHLLRPSKAYY